MQFFLVTSRCILAIFFFQAYDPGDKSYSPDNWIWIQAVQITLVTPVLKKLLHKGTSLMRMRSRIPQKVTSASTFQMSVKASQCRQFFCPLAASKVGPFRELLAQVILEMRCGWWQWWQQGGLETWVRSIMWKLLQWLKERKTILRQHGFIGLLWCACVSLARCQYVLGVNST